MWANKFYYTVKPLIPRSLQIELRRMIAKQQLKRHGNIWPIDEKSSKTPEGWSGWPEGKKFALVLTHDVETEKGQDKCRQLMRLEKDSGFRSSFNFVPERYAVSPELRQQLVSEGFEVGVHGLYHDGKYLASRETFKKRATRINEYLKDWNAVGYRAPSMMGNLEWSHDLNIEYDTSTFDTDPFEPQATSIRTIFPFVVNGSSSQKNYVELPYTLPQDFTLFVLLKDKTIDIWKKKLDWIAEKGGTAILITHPDYMSFNGQRPGYEEYTAEYYKEFLEYVKNRYNGQYWHVLPRELSRFWTAYHKTQCSNPDRSTDMTRFHPGEECSQKVKPRILMIVENAYPGDSRVRKEATALKESYDITVISLRRNYKKWHEIVDGVEVFRLPEVVLAMNGIQNRFMKLLVSVLNYTLQYSFFTSVSAGLFMLTNIRRRYKVIHAHNPPDTLFFVGLLGKLFSIKFVYDHHDLAPELYLSRYAGRADAAHKILLMCEKLSCKLADTVIATNNSYKEIEVNRHGIRPDKIYIVRNDPVVKEFLVNKSADNGSETSKINNKKKNLFYLGSINPQDGVDILIDALKYLVNDLGEKNILCRIIGDGDSLEGIKAKAREIGLTDYLEFTGYLYDREKIKEYLAQSDVCVEPAPDNELNKHSTFIKIMEYMAAGKPIVAFDLKETRNSTNGSALLIQPNDAQGFAVSIKQLIDSPQLRVKLGKAGLERIEKELNWGKASANLIEAYRTLSL